MGSSISSNTTANEHEETQHERGHSYSNIVISGNSQVHNGNVLNVSNFYGQWPDALPRNIWNGGTCNLSGTSTKRKRSVDDDDVGHRTPGEGNPFLDMAIDHLSEFSTSLQHQKQDAGAQKILSWIGVILEAVESSCAASKTPHTAEEVARIQNGLLLTNRVGINLAGRRKLPEQVIGTKRKSSHVVFDKWKIALDTLSCKALDEHGRDVTECFSALRLEPLDFTSASPLAAFFGERTDCLHTTVIHPTIFAFRCVSSESEVFEAIMEDDIAGLIKVFAEQKATIRDCDEEGRSLLHHACHWESLSCCAFLIERGADIDAMAVSLWPNKGAETPLGTSSYRIMPECIVLLMDAGADPSIPSRDTELDLYVSPLEYLLGNVVFNAHHNMTENWPVDTGSRQQQERALHLFLHSNFLDLKAPTSMGLSIWLYAFHRARRYASPEIIQILVTAGCDPRETTKGHPDFSDGWNCLFLKVSTAEEPESSCDLTTLRCLLRHCKDIFATDASGLTIFDHVVATPMKKHLGYQRDLWYCALQREGIDVGQRSDMPARHALYNDDYTPEHYRALCFLDTWHRWNLEAQVHELLDEHPWTEEESVIISRVYKKRAKEKRAKEKRAEKRRAEEKRLKQKGQWRYRNWPWDVNDRVIEEVSDSETSDDVWYELPQNGQEISEDDMSFEQ